MLTLTDVLGQDVLDAGGARVGRLRDLHVRLDAPHPRVTALRVRVGRGDERRIAWSAVESFEPTRVQLGDGAAGVPGAAAEGDELRLVRDVLDAQIVDVAGTRIVRVGDVELAREGDGLRVVAVEVGTASLLRRLGMRRLARRGRQQAVNWEDLHLASPLGHALQLRTTGARVHRLGPRELAQLVARLPVERGAEVLRAVGSRAAAGALSASSPRSGGALVRRLGAAEAAPILAAMPADDATAALRHLGDERLEELLAAVPSERGGVLRRLLAYPASTAGGLMSPDVRTARVDEPVEAVRARLAADPPRLEGLGTVFVLDAGGAVLGMVAPSALLAARLVPVPVPTVRVSAPVEEVIDLFATHDVLALPVLDAAGGLVGAIAVDDVLEELLAERLPGRRRFEALSRRHAPA